MHRLGKIVAGICGLAGALVLATPAVPQSTGLTAVQLPEGPAAIDGPSLSVLTYNVEGLPFPIARGRADAAQRIAERLRALRAENAQPHVVVLQEAFGSAQRGIAEAAGYRYVAYGPDRDLKPADAAIDSDRGFAKAARFFKGERSGKWVGSGIAILSDYPIVDVKRAAFSACAGYDCLANKGVAMAMIAVPGTPQPVAVIATHLNSKAASGVGKTRFNYAFNRQIDTIGAFLHANLAAETPYVLAGDTNIGNSPDRLAYFDRMLAGLPRATASGAVRTALATCLDDVATGCATPAGKDARMSFRRAKDLQVYAAGATLALEPVSISVPFGHERDGTMLSDHIGYVATYRLETGAAARPVAMAATKAIGA